MRLTKYPNKHITLLDPASTLLAAYNVELGKRIADGLNALGVEVILGERLSQPPAIKEARTSDVLNTFVTDKGRAIQADLYFNCYGLRLNTEFFKPRFDSAMDDKGQLRVSQYFRLEGYTNVLAIGDIVNTATQHLCKCVYRHKPLLFPV